MELLYELRIQSDEFIVKRMRQTIADRLSRHKPMRQDRKRNSYVYGRGSPRQFYLPRKCKRNIGSVRFSEAKALLRPDAIEQARDYAGRIARLTVGKA